MIDAKALDRAIAAIADEMVAWANEDATLRHGAQALAQTPRQPRALAARQLPVCLYWDQALALVSGARPEKIAAILRGLAPALGWMQNPNYTEAVMDAHWLRNYGYVELVGGDGHQLADGVRMGFLLFGPQTLYPPHRHPAEEAYFVLGGVAEWQREDGPWQARPPGAIIYHPSGLVHATRTREEPLLVGYIWWGAVATRARVLHAGG